MSDEGRYHYNKCATHWICEHCTKVRHKTEEGAEEWKASVDAAPRRIVELHENEDGEEHFTRHDEKPREDATHDAQTVFYTPHCCQVRTRQSNAVASQPFVQVEYPNAVFVAL